MGSRHLPWGHPDLDLGCTRASRGWACTHRDALGLVLLLLRLEGELNEELLQLFVAIIDAELLKAVRETEVSSVIWGGVLDQERWGGAEQGPSAS